MLKTFFIATAPLLLISATHSFAMDLASYRAVYDLQPVRIEQGSKAQPIDGRLAYEVTGSNCAGWTVASHLLNRTVQAEQGMRVSEIKSQSFEPADGLSMSVSQQESIDDKLADSAEIKIGRLSAGSEAKGILSGSKSLNFSLGSDVIFPTQHQKKLLQAAQDGLTRDVSMVYDGSDGAKQFRIITFIGKKRSPAESQDKNLSSLATLASWSFQLGYYAADNSQSESPEFQATFNMYENGVSTDMLFDYGTYAMKAHVTQFESLPSSACAPAIKVQPQ